MNEVEKNEILMQVSSVLQFCQEIVSRLSSLSSPVPEVNNYDITMEAAHKVLIETNTEFTDEEQENHDIDLCWDAHYPPSQFYTLVFDDDDVSLYSLDESYADFLLPSDMLEDVRMPPDISRSVRMLSDMSRKPENMLMQSVVQFLLLATPDNIYKPNWREAAIKQWIVPELLPVWTNAKEIFDDDKPGDIKYAPPVIEYPSIDLHNVNARFIGNVPKPSLFPIHGVSADPDFYHKLYETEPYKKSFKFLKPAPFGSEYGYDTNIGVVPPSSDPVHGYIWCRGEGWKLYAVKPGDAHTSTPRRRRA